MTTDNFRKTKIKPQYFTIGDIKIGDLVTFDYWKNEKENHTKVISIFKRENCFCVQVNHAPTGNKPYTALENVIKITTA